METKGFNKPGWKTSEFWVLIIYLIARVGLEAGGFNVSQHTWDHVSLIVLSYAGIRQGGKGITDMAGKLVKVKE